VGFGALPVLLVGGILAFRRRSTPSADGLTAWLRPVSQLALAAVCRQLNLSRLIYSYTNGWYEERGAKLYVNRGIGTTGPPIRLGARPEITVLELTRT
jgi:hypothetical protein